MFFFQKISTIPVPFKVKGIGAFKYKSDEFFFTIFYILGFDWGGSEVYIYIKSELHLVEDLKPNILIGNNILYIKYFLINFTNLSTHILECKVSIEIAARINS